MSYRTIPIAFAVLVVAMLGAFFLIPPRRAENVSDPISKASPTNDPSDPAVSSTRGKPAVAKTNPAEHPNHANQSDRGDSTPIAPPESKASSAHVQESLLQFTTDTNDQTKCNPYYAKRQWHVWSIDDPKDKKLPADFSLTAPSKRLYPDGRQFLSCSAEPSKYAGFWDDVYVSQDNFHSSIAGQWNDSDGHSLRLAGQVPKLKRGYYTFGIQGNQISSPATFELKQVGANFTSQSTTGMGHDIANHPIQMLVNEREFYFANVLRSGPAHVSFQELSVNHSTDEYQALVPCIFNSIGSSGSESWALGKLAIAGGHLRTEVKRAAKLRGVYPATLLFLWKAGLPYAERYKHELRHRVAYCADGNDRNKKAKLQADVAMLPHTYDDALHLRRMVNIAKSLTAVPPLSILRIEKVDGGNLVYGGKTAALITQLKDETKVRFSTNESFDIQGLPVTVEVTQLYGTPAAKVRRLSRHEFEVTVPYDPKMPRGRSCFAVIANNGQTDGNPAILNVYRSLGTDNRRPQFNLPDEIVVVPGAKTEFQIDVSDPEGFDVTLSKHIGTLGVLEGKRFVWDCPDDQPIGDYPVTVIASDRCTGSSYNAVRLPLKVQTILASLNADQTEGQAPLSVNFSSEGSRDTKSRPVSFHWDFGDGNTSTQPNPNHVFQQPGLHEVHLTVSADAASVSKTIVIHAQHNWNKVIDNGWSDQGISHEVWNVSSELTAKPSKFGQHQSIHVVVKSRSLKRKSIESKVAIKTPCFVDVEFFRAHKVRGAGIEVFGAVFGRGPLSDGKTYSEDLSFSDHDDCILVGNFPTSPANLSRLRMYVTKDRKNSERYVFSGYLNCDNGESYFRIDNRELAGDRVAILGGELGGQHFTRFNVWAP